MFITLVPWGVLFFLLPFFFFFFFIIIIFIFFFDDDCWTVSHLTVVLKHQAFTSGRALTSPRHASSTHQLPRA